MKKIRKYFITGLLFWVPLLTTLAVVQLLLRAGDALFTWLPSGYSPESIVGFYIPGLGVVISLLWVFFSGVLIANVCGRWIVTLSEHVLARIPLLRSVYYGVKRFLQVFFSNRNSSFQKVVLVEYPRVGMWSIAFVTNDKPNPSLYPEAMTIVFVPTTPNPTSGYILLVPQHEMRTLDMSVDDAIQFIISLGTAGDLKPSTIIDKEKM